MYSSQRWSPALPGIVAEWFDGRYWLAKPNQSDGSENPPRGWGNSFRRGRIKLLSRARAEFRASDRVAYFQPAPRSYKTSGVHVAGDGDLGAVWHVPFIAVQPSDKEASNRSLRRFAYSQRL